MVESTQTPRDVQRPRVPTRRRALALTALAGVLALSTWGGREVVAATTDEAASCAHPQAVQVAAAPAIAEAVRHAADTVVADGTVCAAYEVTAQNPGDTYQSVLSSSSSQPQVWITDSPAWSQLIEHKLGDGWVTVGDTIATSPVVLGVPQQLSAKKGAVSGKSWADLLGDEEPVGLVDPSESSASLMHVIAADQQATSKSDQNHLMQNLLRVSREVNTGQGMTVNALRHDGYAKMFPLSEQQLTSFNQAHPKQPLSWVVPKGGGEQLQYQWVTPVRSTTVSADALQALKQELLSPEEVRYRDSHGFRDAAGDPVRAGILPAGLPMMPAATPRQSVAAQTAWADLKKDARMLVLVDVSGSMLTSTGPGQTRIGVLEGTAISALDALPQTTRMGAWAFSSDLQKNHVDYLPLTHGEQALTNPAYKAEVVKQAKTLPSLAAKNGDTALYDSIAAAYKSVSDSYDPNFINSVVVLTDGTNDDPNGGLNLQQLLGRLKSTYDVDKPVKIVTIAIGDGTDPDALKQISHATDGLSYTTTSPDQIAAVFVDAFLHRTDY